MKVPANSLMIPVSNLSVEHRLMCSDGEWRAVEKVDYVYDIDAATMSQTYAAVKCSGGHSQLVRDQVYIFNADCTQPQKENIPKPKKKKHKPVGVEPLPDIPDDAA